jgi:hypothetical protein
MSGSVSVRRNISSGSGNPSFSSSTTFSGSLASGSMYAGVWSYAGTGLQRADVNGDGRQDLNAIILVPFFVNGHQQGYTSYRAALLGSSTGLSVPPMATWELSGKCDGAGALFQ